MRRSSVLLALSSLYAASASAASCAPNYLSIATWLDDFRLAHTWCGSRYGTPTTTVVVTETSRPQQKRHVFANVVITETIQPQQKRDSSGNIELHSEPLPDDVPHQLKRQSSSSLVQWYFNLMKRRSTDKWVAAVCQCIVPPVTTTVTSITSRITPGATTKSSAKTSTSSTLHTSSLPRSSSPTSTSSPLIAVAPPAATNLGLQDVACVAGPYSGTGACQCGYNVLCGTSGSCGEADETIETPVGSWPACSELCDNNSGCTAWVYSSGSKICTQITDPGCSSDGVEAVEDEDSVLGIYDGGRDCGGVCLI